MVTAWFVRADRNRPGGSREALRGRGGVPHPSVGLLRLRYPADAIADAVAADDDAAMAAIDLDAGPVAIVVHRGTAGVQAERVSDAAFAFLERLFAGEPLGTLLQNTESEAALLAEQFAKGRLSVMDIGTAEDRHASR